MSLRTVVNVNSTVYDDILHHMECVMDVTEKEWENKVKGLLKAELTRKGITYAQLVGKLADIGVVDSERNIRNKMSRGKFTAVFLIQCLEAIGTSSLRLSDG